MFRWAKALLLPVGGVLRLSSAASGIITDLAIGEGDHVAEGQRLFAIQRNVSALRAGHRILFLNSLTSARILERAGALADDRLASQLQMVDGRLGNIDVELSRFQEELRLLSRRIALAQTNLDRQEQLVAASFVSVAQAQQAEADLLALQGQLHSSHRAKASLERERGELLALRDEAILRHRSEISENERELSLVRQEQAENDVRVEQVQVAPFSGTLTGVNVQLGQQVAPGTLLASLIPDAAEMQAIFLSARDK